MFLSFVSPSERFLLPSITCLISATVLLIFLFVLCIFKNNVLFFYYEMISYLFENIYKEFLYFCCTRDWTQVFLSTRQVFSISYLPSIIWGMVGTSVDDCLHLIGLWVYLRDIFLTNDGWKSVQPTIGSTTPGQVVTVYKKAERASKHHSYMVSASVPISGFLLWFLPAMDCYSET